MGNIMSSRRSILKPVSRKGKAQGPGQANTDKRPAARTLPEPTEAPAPKKDTGRRKKTSSGTGMFGSWFDEPADYDEEEDSKTWEQPWALPPTPLSPIFNFSTRTRTPTPPPASKQDGKPAKARSPKSGAVTKQADKLQSPNAYKNEKKSKIKKTSSNKKTSAKPPPVLPSLRPPTSASVVEGIPSRRSLKPRTNLFTLPLEVRDNIYGHLLTAATNVPVMRGWTQCYGRYRGGLEPAILSVCRQTYEEGVRILYMTNTFMYLIRDGGEPVSEALNPAGFATPTTIPLDPPPLSELRNGTKGRAPKRQKRAKPVTKKSTVGEINRVIYLAKYAHLLRRVEIVLESNRDTKQYGLAMARAIQLLGSGEGGFRTNLTSLQFSLTPVAVDKPGGATEWPVVKFFSSPSSTQTDIAKKSTKPVKEESQHLVTTALRNLQVRLLHFTVYTPSSRRLDMTLDMTHHVTSPNDLTRLLAHDDIVAKQRAEVAAASSEAFDSLALLIERACADTDKAVQEGWWTEYGPPQVAAVRSAMEEEGTLRGRMKKYRSPWYEKMRDEFVAQPDHACCVRKVGRRLLPAGEQ